MSQEPQDFNKPFVLAKGLRVLPPGGGFASPWQLLKTSWQLRFGAGLTLSHRELLARAVQTCFSVEKATIAGSGKEGICLLAEVWRREVFERISIEVEREPVCWIPAYTCPDVAASLISVGFKLKLYDLDPQSLKPKYPAFSPDELVLLANLYGLPDRLPETEVSVLDDACQAGLSYSLGERVGGRGFGGVLSFGRGKAFPSAGGGAALFTAHPGEKPVTKVSQKHLVSQAARMFLLWLLQSPFLYKIPVSIPALHLGKTEYKPEFKREPSRPGSCLSAFVQLGDSAARSEVFVENSRKWTEALSGIGLTCCLEMGQYSKEDRVVPIRFPVVMPSEASRDEAWEKLSVAGLGATCSYPRPISDYPEIRKSVLEYEEAGAREISKKILTLPVHRFLRQKDIIKTRDILKSCI